MFTILLQDPSLLPHGYCYQWQPGLLSLHVISDSIITLSYYSIPIGLVWLIRKRQDLPFGWMFWLFAIFIAGCGTTHLMEIWTLWRPDYWVSGGIKVVTALASIGTAIALIPLLPKAVALPTPTQLALANRELAVVNHELESFSYSVAHDLRAPLRAIDGFALALHQDYQATLDPEAQRLLGLVSGNARRMGQLIDDILSFSRLSRQEPQAAPVDMAELVRGVVDELRHDPKVERVRFTVAPLPPAQGDRALLRQVLVNLLANAIKFSGRRTDPEITISGQQTGDEAIYTVRDNGVGFDMRHASKLFGLFHRLHHLDEFEGTGVGLGIVKRIIERHGGRVWAEAAVDQGARFHFTLPTTG